MVATLGDFLTRDIVAEITRRCRDEMVQMILRVAKRESDAAVAARLREIADAFKEARL